MMNDNILKRNSEIMDEISDCLLDNSNLPEKYSVEILSSVKSSYGWFGGYSTEYVVTAPDGQVCKDSVELHDELPVGKYVPISI
jgi:hypothetical protein